jgi:hypothetical protein
MESGIYGLGSRILIWTETHLQQDQVRQLIPAPLGYLKSSVEKGSMRLENGDKIVNLVKKYLNLGFYLEGSSVPPGSPSTPCIVHS